MNITLAELIKQHLAKGALCRLIVTVILGLNHTQLLNEGNVQQDVSQNYSLM